MRNIVCLVFTLVFMKAGYAQFVNNGATVTIQAGATLKVESNFINENAGTFTNNGVLEVTGNFTNSATFTSGVNSEVIFSGNANSTVTPGTAQFRDVTLAKTNANVVLAGNMTVNGVLDFSTANNKVVLGNHNLTMGATGSVTNAGSNKYVVATGAGRFIKPISANGTLNFEVGDATVATNYSPLSCAVTGTSYAGASIGVNLVNAVHPDKPGTANDFLTRHWDVDLTGTIGSFNNVITGTFIVSDDVVGTQANIDGAVWNGATWSYTNAGHSGNTVTASTTTGDVDFTGFTGRALFNLTAYIQGYMNGGTMRPVLLNSGVAGATSSQCDTITIQLRNTTAPFGVAHSYKGVIGVNGQLECIFPPSAIGNNYYVAIQHRNALETWSANPITLLNNGSYNFSTGSSQAFGGNMTQVGSLWCIYSGDIDNDGEVLPGDYTLWLVSNINGDIGYFDTDLDGDGEVLPADYTIWLINNNAGVIVQTP